MPQLIETMRKTTASGGVFPMRVMGYSMNPTLGHARDTVYLVSKENRPAKPGEILFFMRPDGSGVLHRLIRILPDGSFLMNGDAQCWTETIHSEQVIAVVSHFIRKGTDISCDGCLYRFYVRLWGIFRPMRPAIGKVIRLATHLSKRSGNEQPEIHPIGELLYNKGTL